MCDSLGESTFIASNAVGQVRGHEMSRLRDMATHYRATGYAVCYALHHHVARILDDEAFAEATSLRGRGGGGAGGGGGRFSRSPSHPKAEPPQEPVDLGASSSTLPDHENTDRELAVQWSLRIGPAPRGPNRQVNGLSVGFVATRGSEGSAAVVVTRGDIASL